METNKKELTWLTFEEQLVLVKAAIARFPEEFALRGFPGERFRVSEYASYFSDRTDPNSLKLYTERLCEDGEWNDFAKGTESELRGQVRPLP